MVSVASRRAVFPGSFNPLTVAHLEIANLAREQHDLDEVHFVVSHSALDKPDPEGPPFDQRVALLKADAQAHDWLVVETTELQLIADIAQGYDAVIMGADKWFQVNDERYYASEIERDAAVARLPTVIVAERAGQVVDDSRATALRTPSELHHVSSTAARAGARYLMAPKARESWN